jgi:hypothetical protein
MNVGHLHGVGVAHVDLVLAGTDLMVGVLDVDAELLERQDGLAANVGAGVERRQVEVAAVVEHLGALGVLKEEVLQLGAHVERVKAHRAGPLQCAPQDVARIALVGRALGRQHVAEQAPDALLLRPPGEDREGRGVGHGEHVGLLDGIEAGDRGAVETHAVLERVVKLVAVDRE